MLSYRLRRKQGVHPCDPAPTPTSVLLVTFYRAHKISGLCNGLSYKDILTQKIPPATDAMNWRNCSILSDARAVIGLTIVAFGAKRSRLERMGAVRGTDFCDSPGFNGFPYSYSVFHESLVSVRSITIYGREAPYSNQRLVNIVILLKLFNEQCVKSGGGILGCYTQC